MSDMQIPNLPQTIGLDGTEQIEVVQAGTTRKTPFSQVLAYIVARLNYVTRIDTKLPIEGGPITSTGTISLKKNSLTNDYLFDMDPHTIKGNNAAGSTYPSDLSGSLVTAMLSVFSQTKKGLVPPPSTLANLYLRDDGTWQAPSISNTIPWTGITNTPTTLVGYGIQDAVTINTAQSVTGKKTFTVGSVFNAGAVFNDGAANAPSISFTGDPDTGFFHSVAGNSNAVGLAIGGVEAARFDTGNTFLRGTTALVTGLTINTVHAGTTVPSSSSATVMFGTGAAGPLLHLGHSHNAAVGSYVTPSALDDQLGIVQFSGSDTAKMMVGASIRAYADGTAALNSVPGRLSFWTFGPNPVAPALVERLRIASDGTATFTIAGVVSGRVEGKGATIIDDQTLLNKQKADPIYAKTAVANKFLANQTIENATDASLILNDSNATLPGKAQSRVVFNATGLENGYVGYNNTDDLDVLNRQGDINMYANQTHVVDGGTFRFYTDGTLTASIVPASATPSPTNIITRGTGDVRYAPIAGIDFQSITPVGYLEHCRFATTENIDLTSYGLTPIDGVTDPHVGDRVLVKDQNNAIENGIYVIGNPAWSRAPDALANTNTIAAAMTTIYRGAVNGGTQWATSMTRGSLLVGVNANHWYQLIRSSANTFIGNQTIEKVDPKLTINDSDGTLGAAHYAYVETQANGAQSGWWGFFTNSAAMQMVSKNTGVIISANDSKLGPAGSAITLEVENVVVGKLEANGVLTGDTSLVNRKQGDLRYLQLGGSTSLGSTFGALLIDGPKATYRTLGFYTSAKPRWNMYTDDATESGSNNGSNFGLNRYSDTGAYLGQAFSIRRSDGFTSFGGNVAVPYLNISGDGNYFLQVGGADNVISYGSGYYWGYGRSSGLLRWVTKNSIEALKIDNIGQLTVADGNASKPGGGAWNGTSDARIKDVGAEYTSGLDAILALRPVNYTFRGNDTATAETTIADAEGVYAEAVAAAPFPASPHFQSARDAKPFVGLVAQEVEAVMPEMVTNRHGFIDGVEVEDLKTLDPSLLVYALINAVKTLNARIEALEAR